MRHTGTPLRILFLLLAAFVLVAAAVSVALRHSGPARAGNHVTVPVAEAVPPAPAVQLAEAAPAAPASASQSVRPRAARSPQSAPGAVSLRAYLDPETGTFGAPPPQVVETQSAGAPVAEPSVVTLPSGAEMLVGSPPDYVFMQIDSTGRRVIRTVSDPKQARLAPIPAAKPVER
jgi:hypothetical protein